MERPADRAGGGSGGDPGPGSLTTHRRRQLRPRHVLFLLLLVIVVWLHTARAACHVNDIYVSSDSYITDDSTAIEELIDACGGVSVSNNGRCTLTDNLCDTGVSFVRTFVCVDDTWLWAPNATFCPYWHSCEWKGENLTCNDAGGTSNAFRVPPNFDPRIRYLDIRHYSKINSVSSRLSQMGRNLQSVVIRDSTLRKINTGAFVPLTKLVHLDLSNNQITEVDYDELPPYGALRYLDLRGNRMLTKYDPYLFHASLGTCDPSEPLHQLFVDANKCQVVMENSCQHVVCVNGTQPEVAWKCRNEERISAVRVCDGRIDCADSSDENFCNPELQFTNNGGGYCDFVSEGLVPQFTIRSGLIIIALDESSTIFNLFEKRPILLMRLAADQADEVQDDENKISSSLGEKVFEVNVSVPEMGAPFTCRFNYTVERSTPTTATTITIPVGATTPGASTSQSSASTAGAAAGAAAGGSAVVVVVVLVVLLLRRRRRNKTQATLASLELEVGSPRIVDLLC